MTQSSKMNCELDVVYAVDAMPRRLDAVDAAARV